MTIDYNTLDVGDTYEQDGVLFMVVDVIVVNDQKTIVSVTFVE